MPMPVIIRSTVLRTFNEFKDQNAVFHCPLADLVTPLQRINYTKWLMWHYIIKRLNFNWDCRTFLISVERGLTLLESIFKKMKNSAKLSPLI